MKLAVCALYDGQYHLGLGALVNSLWQAGFRGDVFAGYRGRLPDWARCNADGCYPVAEGLRVVFVPADTSVHLTNYKPDFILEIMDRLDPRCDGVIYFDVDIVVLSKWRLFEEWVTYGVALCSDIHNLMMHPTDPIKNKWRVILKEMGVETREVMGYANGGFVGVLRENRELVEIWSAVIARIPAFDVHLDTFHLDDRSHPFFAMDQDALNMALMGSTVPFSLAGQEAMAIRFGGAFMAHSVAGPKPWQRRGHFRLALRGLRPSPASRAYWKFVREPIPVFSESQRRWALFEIKAAAALARVLG